MCATDTPRCLQHPTHPLWFFRHGERENSTVLWLIARCLPEKGLGQAGAQNQAVELQQPPTPPMGAGPKHLGHLPLLSWAVIRKLGGKWSN